jgi:hypothetical protein
MLGTRLILLVTAAVAVAAATIALVTGAAAPPAHAAFATHGLVAYVVPTNRGPLPACADDGSDCTAANWVWWYVHVGNMNRPTNFAFGSVSPTRATVPNAYVVTSVDESFLVDGVETSTGPSDTLVPPPNLTHRFGSAGRFLSTVTCGQPVTVPCNTVAMPAVVPGESTAVYFEGWAHQHVDPNGMLVAKFTVHGTLNGVPVTLNASSPPISEIG